MRRRIYGAILLVFIVLTVIFSYIIMGLEHGFSDNLVFRERTNDIYLANKVIEMEWKRSRDGWVLNKLGYLNGRNCIDPNKTWIDIIQKGTHNFFAPSYYSVLSNDGNEVALKFETFKNIDNITWTVRIYLNFYAGEKYYFTLKFEYAPDKKISGVEGRCYPVIEIPDDVRFIWTDMEGDGAGVPTFFWHERRNGPKYLGICKYGDEETLLNTRIKRGNYGPRFGFCLWNAKSSFSAGEIAISGARLVLTEKISYMWSLIKEWRNWNYEWINSWNLTETNMKKIRDESFSYMFNYFKWYPEPDTPSDKGCFLLSYAGNDCYGMGFSSSYSSLMIRPLLYFGIEENRSDWINKAVAIGNMAIEVFQNTNASDACYGAFWDNYNVATDEKTDFYGRPWYWIVHGSRIANQILYLYSYTKEQKYLDSAKRYFNFLLRYEDDVRGLPAYVDATSGKPNEYQGTDYPVTIKVPPNRWSTAAIGESIRLASFLYKNTGNDLFLIYAKKWADLMLAKHKPYCIGGFLEDVLGIENAAYGSVINGLVFVYDLTGEEKYLDFAKQCAQYGLTAQYMINYEGKKPGAGGFQCNDGGGGWAGYVGFASPPDNTQFVLALLNLYVRTLNPDYHLAALAYMKWLINIRSPDGSWAEMISETNFADENDPNPISMPVEPGWTAGNCGYLLGAFYDRFKEPIQNQKEALDFMKKIWWAE